MRPSVVSNAGSALARYELFTGEGAAHGRDLEHWLRAEHELRERISEPLSGGTVGS